MNETTRLLDAVAATRTSGTRAAVATVVRVKGSAYRREGTKMLIDEDGGQVCMISGGCLEQEVGEVAREVMATGKPVVKPFDLDEDVVWGLGLGCGGSVDVYVEPLDMRRPNTRFLEVMRTGAAGCLATVITAEEGLNARLFIAPDGSLGGLGDVGLDTSVKTWALDKLDQLYPRAETRSFMLGGGEVEVFLDVNVPPPELILFGAGHDAIPVAETAYKLGFKVTVVDARHTFVTAERFPHARLVRAHPSGFAEHLRPSRRSYAVIMNHHLERDTESLAFALRSKASYVGVLGPASRYQDMLNALGREDRRPAPEALLRVRNPVGVDIGADTPQEIAVSILAELIALRGGYQAGFLNDRDGPIHADRQAVPRPG